MAYGKMKEFLQTELNGVREAGLYKQERYIFGPQGADIKVEFPTGAPKKEVLNFCANNYLGLSSHPETVKSAHKALDDWGYGLSSVRFICGTQDIHRQLEKKIADFLGMDDAILYSSCFDANGGLFEVLFKEEDAILTDALNHASVIDGIRLSKAARYIIKHMDLADLEEKLKSDAVQKARFRVFATDGAFSMDGDVALLPQICDLCEKYDTLVMVDDSHSTGFMGKHGKGTHEHCGVMNRVDIITSTMGKALGGASGGFTAARKEIVELLRQRSRPYLFSNTLPPVIAASAVTIIVRHPAGRAPHRADNALQRQAGPGLRPRHVCRGHLRHRVLLPGSGQGSGPHPRAALSRTRDRAHRQGDYRLHQGRPEVRHPAQDQGRDRREVRPVESFHDPRRRASARLLL
jgi:glycine C-acetyltransferase